MHAQPYGSLLEQLDQTAFISLSNLLDRTLEGNDEVVRTNFLEHLSGDEILQDFEEKVYAPGLEWLNSTLQEIELKQKDKFGPRSIQKSWEERRSQILEHFDPPQGIDTSDRSDFINLFHGQGTLRPKSWPEVSKAMKRTTSSGLPYMRPKGKLLDDGFDPEGVHSGKATFEGGPWPCVLFTRTQEGGKTRDIWGESIYTLAFEGKYFLPVFNILKVHPMLTALQGPDAVDIAITTMLNSRGPGEYCLSEDFQAFDATVGTDLQAVAFTAIASFFQPEERDNVQRIADQFSSIGIVTPDGVWSGEHGIPSGSCFTNLVGSLVHAYAQSQIIDLCPSSNQVMGDDGVMILPETISPEDLQERYGSMGLKFNAEKTFQSEDEVIYLQRYYSSDYKRGRNYVGVYPIFRALGRLVYMERKTNMTNEIGDDYFAIRAISIMENCKFHPLHEEFVKWVFQNDMYGLEYSQDSLKRYLKSLGSKITTNIKNQYSDYVEGIHSFETVKILKRL